jgi:signal transduction histidine kinase
MTQVRFSQRDSRLIQAAVYATLAAILIGGASSAPTPFIRWATIGLLLLFGLLFGLWPVLFPSLDRSPWPAHLYLALQTALAAALMVMSNNWTLFTILFFILSVQAVLLLPPRPALAWIAGFALVTAALGVVNWGLSGGLWTIPFYAGGYALMAVFAHALTEAQAARQRSQELVEELQAAQAKMQEYTGRIEELAVVEERSRLAREMHDTLGHRLTVASVQLEGAQRLIDADPARAAQMVGTVREQVREALAELRLTVAALRAPIEADLSLPHALARLAAHFEQATGITVHQVLPRDDELPDLPGPHRLALYRTAQEALTNVQRHAQAGQVWLVLATHDDEVTLLVGDDGKGLAVSAGEAGFGLRGLRDRAAELGGELHVEPRRGGGAHISLRLPISSPETARSGDFSRSSPASPPETARSGDFSRSSSPPTRETDA